MLTSGKDVEKLNHSYIAAEKAKCYIALWRRVRQFF